MRTLRTLLKLTAHHPGVVWLCGAVIVFVSALTVVMPLYTKFVLEHVVPARDGRLLDMTFLFLLGFLVVRFALVTTQDFAVVVMRQRLERSYNERYLDAVFHLRPDEFDGHKAGEILSRFAAFLNDIEWFLCDFVFFVFYALFVFAFLSVVMALLDPLLYAAVVAFIPLHAWSFRATSSRLRGAAERGQREQDRLFSFALESLEGWSDIRTYHLQRRFEEEDAARVAALADAALERKVLGYAQPNAHAPLILVTQLAIVALRSYQIVTGAAGVGTLFFFLLLLDFFYSPIYRFGAVNEALQSACVKIGRMAEFIEHERLEARREEDPPAARPVARLRVRDLALPPLFAGLDYTFEAGRIYFLTGASGCGKTSLLHALTRLRRATAGSVELDGDDIAAWPEPAVRRHIQCGLQDSALFAGSLAENIQLGRAAAAERLGRASYHAVLDDLLASLPGGLDHLLEEAGRNLSGGQQQRIGLARLFYHDAPVMLLDEPTSALDAATERLFFARLHELKRDKILVVVNHRPQALPHADVILRLERGGLVEIGGGEAAREGGRDVREPV